jgi:hypothetical protein
VHKVFMFVSELGVYVYMFVCACVHCFFIESETGDTGLTRRWERSFRCLGECARSYLLMAGTEAIEFGSLIYSI